MAKHRVTAFLYGHTVLEVEAGNEEEARDEFGASVGYDDVDWTTVFLKTEKVAAGGEEGAA